MNDSIELLTQSMVALLCWREMRKGTELMRYSGSLVEDAGIRTMICKEVLKNACDIA
jgi:hypothetical protein